MNYHRSTLVAASLAALLTPVISFAQCGGGGGAHSGGHGDRHRAPNATPHGDHGTALPPNDHRTVRIEVTSNGFVPAEIKLARGEPVTLVVTRSTDDTCARDIVIPAWGVKQRLPLGESVVIELTPSIRESVRFACGMDGISGLLVVE